MKDYDNPNRGWPRDRLINNRLEAAFAEAWERENYERSGINFGNGTLQDLFMSDMGMVHFVSDSERFVAATVVQWLGTNCGFAFMQTCLNSCGYLIHGSEPRHPLKDPLIQELLLAAAASDARQMVFDLCEPH